MIDRKPHVHAALIKQWADGAQIEYFSELNERWMTATCPKWSPQYTFRVKPVPHPQQDLIDAARNGDSTIQFQGALGTGEWYSFLPALVDEFREGVPHDVKLRRAHKWQKEMDAYAAGKEVQCRCWAVFSTGCWNTFTQAEHGDLSWTTAPCWEYRIKPEPVKFFMQINDNPVSPHGKTLAPRFDANLMVVFEDGKLVDAKVLQSSDFKKCPTCPQDCRNPQHCVCTRSAGC
jgi:hypothetical protein